MRDLENRKDIEQLVRTFYKKVLVDESIGYIFTSTIAFIEEKHLPIMFDFWESVILGQGSYRGNPIAKHIELNNKETLTEQHFDQWLFLWGQTIDELFFGDNAKIAYEKAVMMKNLMLYKIGMSQNPFSIQ